MQRAKGRGQSLRSRNAAAGKRRTAVSPRARKTKRAHGDAEGDSCDDDQRAGHVHGGQRLAAQIVLPMRPRRTRKALARPIPSRFVISRWYWSGLNRKKSRTMPPKWRDAANLPNEHLSGVKSLATNLII